MPFDLGIAVVHHPFFEHTNCWSVASVAVDQQHSAESGAADAIQHIANNRQVGTDSKSNRTRECRPLLCQSIWNSRVNRNPGQVADFLVPIAKPGSCQRLDSYKHAARYFPSVGCSDRHRSGIARLASSSFQKLALITVAFMPLVDENVIVCTSEARRSIIDPILGAQSSYLDGLNRCAQYHLSSSVHQLVRWRAGNARRNSVGICS